MANYDFSLDMTTDNSNSLILRSIKPNSKVLEMGPAHGRMTKYLKEQLNCSVYIVEQDYEAGKVAAQFADASWIGSKHESYGNIDDGQWFDDLFNDEKERFDYVIFADVLEHLLDPEAALRLAAQLLKKDGSIIISVPNIGYNGLVIDLLQDNFSYRDYGILDKTHLKFFTFNSLKKFVADAGLTIVKQNNPINTIDNSEFDVSYSQLPKEVSDYLKKRKYGDVYQFIWELKKAELQISIVIPVFNKINFTLSTLKDLSHLDPTKVEIIVVNNASTDETRKELDKLIHNMSNLKVIHNNENMGFGWASDQGYVAAKADKVLFLNNDIRVKANHLDWIDVLIQACDDNSLVGPTGGKVDSNNNFEFMYETDDPNKDINYLSGWCLAAKKNVFNQLIEPDNVIKGPFTNTLFCYFEDTHMGFSAIEKGIAFKLVNVPVTHFGKISSKQLNTYSLYQTSKDIFKKRWSSKK